MRSDDPPHFRSAVESVNLLDVPPLRVHASGLGRWRWHLSYQRHEFRDFRLLTATILHRTAQSSHPRSWLLRRPIVSIPPYSLPSSLPGPDYKFNGRSLAMLSPPLLLHNGPATLSRKLCVPHAHPEGSYRPCKADRVLFLLPGANKPIRISIPQCFEDLLTPDHPIFILQCA